MDANARSFEISDPGLPFDPLERVDPGVEAAFEDRPIGGMGSSRE